MANKSFTYSVKYYPESELTLAPTKRTASTHIVEATSAPRAVSRAQRELGIESARQWVVVSVTPVLDEYESRRYQL